jgi:hypothetical protein
MWRQVAKRLHRFPDAVLTATTAEGYPVSVRQATRHYDRRTGELRVSIPPNLGPVPGRANLLAHRHDENLWNLDAIQVKGRLERRAGGWVFVSTSCRKPPPRGVFRAMWRLQKTLRRAADRYLAQRGLARPQVDWAAVDLLYRQATGRH